MFSYDYFFITTFDFLDGTSRQSGNTGRPTSSDLGVLRPIYRKGFPAKKSMKAEVSEITRHLLGFVSLIIFMFSPLLLRKDLKFQGWEHHHFI